MLYNCRSRMDYFRKRVLIDHNKHLYNYMDKRKHIELYSVFFDMYFL